MNLKPLPITQHTHRMLADLQTPVGLYRKVRTRYSRSALLESTDFDNSRDNHSYIGFDPLATFSVCRNEGRIQNSGFGIQDSQFTIQDSGFAIQNSEFRIQNQEFEIQESRIINPESKIPNSELRIPNSESISGLLQEFIQSIQVTSSGENDPITGLFGYSQFEAARYFDPSLASAPIAEAPKDEQHIPEVLFTLYRFVIEVNHSQNELILTENLPHGETSRIQEVLGWLDETVAPVESFRITGTENSTLSEAAYAETLQKAQELCSEHAIKRLAISRRFKQPFGGDDFQVYRTLRSIAPSAYLFYFDFESYRILGSSPEPLLTIRQGKAQIALQAGHLRRSGDDTKDRQAAQQLQHQHPHQSRHHEWEVNLAMEQLSRHTANVRIDFYCDVQQHAQMMHVVSRLSGEVSAPGQGYSLLGEVFPAGNIVGIPKVKAMQIMATAEAHARGFFGGCIGFLGLQGDIVLAVNHRSFLSHQNILSSAVCSGIIQENTLIEDTTALEYREILKRSITLAETLKP